MPTPTGLLKRGDIIKCLKDGRLWRITDRLGNDMIYAVRMVTADGKPLGPNDRSRGYALLTTVPYHLKNGWSVVDDAD
jgi:hypothetical protein